MSKDFFAKKAVGYDKLARRVANVSAIVDAMVEQVALNTNMHLMDFGAGTGLLLEGIAPLVGKVTAVDISKAMITELEKKRSDLSCELHILQADLLSHELQAQFTLDSHLGFNEVFIEGFNEGFDGIISSMTLHHIKDIPAVFSLFKRLLKTNGFIALADLDTEDGSFHTEDTGVFHHGFDRSYLIEVAKGVGFSDIQISTANQCEKNGKKYSVFLMVGRG